MGHYASEMPDIEHDVSSPGVSQLWDWINTTVDVMRDHGGKMRQADLERVAAKVLGISRVRMPYVINSAIAENLIQRGGSGAYDRLTLV